MRCKERELLIAWVGVTIETLVREGHVREWAINNELVCKVRGICARHVDLFTRNMPNAWFAVAKMMIDCVVTIQIISFAFGSDFQGSDHDEPGEDAGHSHPAYTLYIGAAFVFVSSFLISATYWLAWAMVELLANPFSAHADSYNCDSLMASTDRQLFTVLRATFDAFDTQVVHLGRSGATVRGTFDTPVLS